MKYMKSDHIGPLPVIKEKTITLREFLEIRLKI